jgi:hypothetical protein
VVDPVGGYATPQDELIARAPIRDNNGAYIASYQTDRAKSGRRFQVLHEHTIVGLMLDRHNVYVMDVWHTVV